MNKSSPPSPQAIASRLLAWPGRGQRPFPWRQNRDPYVVWISETMLQQTQIATVIPYLERWLERFPNVETLAAAPLEEVLKMWEGLGYYARARNLHRAAQIIVRQHGGRIPADRDALLALPGIGPYTAGAILSLAYGQDEPVVDGNVRRVLCRVFGVDEDPRRPRVERRLWELARDIIVSGRARDINEALMDLGREICTPRGPACDRCPLADVCVAHATGREEELPVRAAKRRVPHYTVTAGVIWNERGEILLAQRPLDGLLGGLWEFPGGKVEPGEAPQAALVREIREELGVEVAVEGEICTVEHRYPHLAVRMTAYGCRVAAGEPRPLHCQAFAWVEPGDLLSYPMPDADRPVARRVISLLGP